MFDELSELVILFIFGGDRSTQDFSKMDNRKRNNRDRRNKKQQYKKKNLRNAKGNKKNEIKDAMGLISAKKYDQAVRKLENLIMTYGKESGLSTHSIWISDLQKLHRSALEPINASLKESSYFIGGL